MQPSRERNFVCGSCCGILSRLGGTRSSASVSCCGIPFLLLYAEFFFPGRDAVLRVRLSLRNPLPASVCGILFGAVETAPSTRSACSTWLKLTLCPLWQNPSQNLFVYFVCFVVPFCTAKTNPVSFVSSVAKTLFLFCHKDHKVLKAFHPLCSLCPLWLFSAT